MSAVLQAIGMLAFSSSTVVRCPIFRIYSRGGMGKEYQENAFEYVTLKDVYDIILKGLTTDRYTTCPLGLWMGYEEDRFFGVINFFGDRDGSVSKCQGYRGQYVQSLEVVGHPTDYTASEVVTYMRRHNEWQDSTYSNDTPRLQTPMFGSLIVTGNEEVEIFTEPDFQGESWCIGPNNGFLYFKTEYDERNHLRNGTELFSNIQVAQNIMGRQSFNSVRFGCGKTKHRF